MQTISYRPPLPESPFWATLAFGRRSLNGIEKKVPQMLSNEQIRAQLEIEMLRSDRTASPLTLLLFDVQNAPDLKTLGLAMEKLALLIGLATRKTDSKGWYHDGRGLHVMLMLVSTPPSHADRIIAMIRQRFQEELAGQPPFAALDLSCAIYAYPCDPSQDEGPDQQLSLFEEEPADSPPADPPSPNGHGNGNGHAHGNGNGNGHSPNGSLAPAQRVMGAVVLPADLLLVNTLPIWKRALDVTLSLLALVLLSPFLLLIALLIKVTSPGPAIFKQERVGYRGRHFLLWKFRSMTVHVDNSQHRKYLSDLITQGDDKPMLKLDKGDAHITAIGRILRVSCLDELPQLINVLKGEMSLVGPRPCLPYELAKYQRWHYRRLDTVPGITGLWQVMGKNRTTFRQMIRFDIIYARRCCFWLDLKILFMTVPAVFHEMEAWFAAKAMKEAENVQRA